MKKFLALTLALCLCFGLLACGGGEEPAETPGATEPAKVEDDGIMKILMIGHSLGNDSTFMLPDIARQNGVENLVMGVIYHSGCRLGQHVSYLEDNQSQYAYYEFDISGEQKYWLRADRDGNFTDYDATMTNDEFIGEKGDGPIAQTMQFGIQRHDWDIVVMQAGVFEAANVVDGGYSPNFAADIKTIQDYVLENDIEKGSTPKFVWNMTWACPSDIMTYGNKFYGDNTGSNFGGDTDKMYEAIAATAKDVVAPAHDWAHIIPSGTALHNARAKYGPRELYRDFIHVNDFGRAIVGYTWFCTLFGKNIEECNIAPIDSALLLDNLMRNTGKSLELTEEQKAVLIESVKNAMANPYAVTASQIQ